METKIDRQTDRVIYRETEINLNWWETLCLFNKKALILTSYLRCGRCGGRGLIIISALEWSDRSGSLCCVLGQDTLLCEVYMK